MVTHRRMSIGGIRFFRSMSSRTPVIGSVRTRMKEVAEPAISFAVSTAIGPYPISRACSFDFPSAESAGIIRTGAGTTPLRPGTFMPSQFGSADCLMPSTSRSIITSKRSWPMERVSPSCSLAAIAAFVSAWSNPMIGMAGPIAVMADSPSWPCSMTTRRMSRVRFARAPAVSSWSRSRMLCSLAFSRDAGVTTTAAAASVS